MAETSDSGGGLLVQIGVTQARMERELAKLVKGAAKSANDMEKLFGAANNNIGKSAGTAFNNATKGANQATGAIKNTSGATSNLAAQLNDIGVQLAGGQSPFLIMLQQGTQITQLFTSTGTSIRGFGSILAGAVTSVLNPFSLLTFAIIGAGGYAVQYFMDLVSGGENANKVLDEQRKLVESVAQKWGDAVPALQAYVDQLQRAKDIGELNEATENRKTEVWDDIRAQLEEFNAEYGRTIDLLTYTEFDNKAVQDLGQAYDELKEKIENGTATTEDFQHVAELTNAAATSGITGLDQFAGAFAGLSQFIIGATKDLAAWQRQVAGAVTTKYPSQGTYEGVQRSADGRMGGTGTVLPENGPVPTEKPSTEGQYAGGTWKKPRSGGGGRGANAYKDEVAGIKERTAALRESTAAQASVNPLVSDYGYALEKAKAEQKLLADAQRAGLTITPQLQEQISTLAGEYASASAEAKKLAAEQTEVKKQAEAWASLEKDVFKGFISDLKHGKSGAEALSNALNKVADKLLDMAPDGLFSPKATGGGSGLFGSILGGIGKIFGFSKGTANTGGKRGQAAGVVHGQEAVIPLPAGGKVPVTLNTPTTAAMGRAASRDVVDIRLADDSGRMADIADQRIKTASGTIVKVSVDQSYKSVKSNFASLMTDTQSRNFT